MKLGNNNYRVVERFKTLEKDFINKFGNKFDYSKSIYNGYNKLMSFTCNDCGYSFETTPKLHLNSSIGCKVCSKQIQITKEEFVEKSKSIYGDKYDYSLIKNGSIVFKRKKIPLICKSCDNTFTIVSYNHLNGINGCNYCGVGKGNTSSFIYKSVKVHGDKYDYSLVNYSGNRDKINIICKKCKKITNMSRLCHLQGQGCENCTKIQKYKDRTFTNEEFIRKRKKVHGDKYDYSLINYTHNTDMIEVKCNKHGIFKIRASSFIKIRGCQLCGIENGNFGFKPNLPRILYYLSIDNGRRYKIGVTNRTVKERYSRSELKRIKIVKEWYYDIGTECLKMEKQILNDYSYRQWNGEPLLINGNTELFDRDILLLDNQK